MSLANCDRFYLSRLVFICLLLSFLFSESHWRQGSLYVLYCSLNSQLYSHSHASTLPARGHFNDFVGHYQHFLTFFSQALFKVFILFVNVLITMPYIMFEVRFLPAVLLFVIRLSSSSSR